MVSSETDWALAAAKKLAKSAHSQGVTIPADKMAELLRDIEDLNVHLSGEDRMYTTEEAASILGKSHQWMYWAKKPREEGGGGQFYYQDNTPIEPNNVGKKRNIWRFDLKTIIAMAASMHRKATIDFSELEEIVRRVQLARIGKYNPSPSSPSGD